MPTSESGDRGVEKEEETVAVALAAADGNAPSPSSPSSASATLPISVRGRAFTQIEQMSTSAMAIAAASTAAALPQTAAIPVGSPVNSPVGSPMSSPLPAQRKTLEIKGLTSPTRSTTAAVTAAAIATAARARAAKELASSPSSTANPRTPTNPPSTPPRHERVPSGAWQCPSSSPARRTAAEDIAARKLTRVAQWKEEAERLSLRVQQLERENRKLRSSTTTPRASARKPPRTVMEGNRMEDEVENSDDDDDGANDRAMRTSVLALSDQESDEPARGRGKARMLKSKSIASHIGATGLLTGLTVAEAAAASHRTRSKRLDEAQVHKYKSGYWNPESMMKSSVSLNNLADMEQRAIRMDKPYPLFVREKSHSTNTRSQAKASRDTAALMRSSVALASRKSESFHRNGSDLSAEDLAAHHKQQLAMAHSFRGAHVMRVPPSSTLKPDTDIDALSVDSGAEEDEFGDVHVASPRSYFEASLRGIGGSFRLPSRSKSLGRTKRASTSDVRIWVGTWNMGAADPFVDRDGIIDEQRSGTMLQEFLPHDYHVYVLGVQEGVSENVYHAVEAYLNRNENGTRYQRMELKNSEFMLMNRNHPLDATIDAVRGRGDGAFVGTKFTGLAVFYAAPVRDKVKLLRAGMHKFNLTSGSKGGVAAALMINKTSLVFINCHLDARNDSYRREQIRNLNANLGKAMGHPSFDLTEQFHHVVWMGDMNYRIVHLDPDSVLHMIEGGRNAELHDKFDGLLNDRRNGGVFDGFTEPNKFLDFYPTYKKFPRRGRLNYDSPSWSRLVYRVLYKEPFYKGGKVKKRVPGWCDRILTHSLLVSDSKLVPEKVKSPFDVSGNAWIDNYRSVNEGEGMDVSDHSPVFATFVLSFPQVRDLEATAMLRLTRRNSRSLSEAVQPEPMSLRASTGGTGGSYFDQPHVIRRIAANVPERPVSTVLRVFNMQLYWNDNVVVPKRTRVVSPLVGEDSKQCDVIGERCQGLNGPNLSLNAVVHHTRPLEHLHMLVWVKNESISGHCTLSLKRIARQDEGGEVKFRVPLYNNSMRLYYDGHPLVLVFSVRSKTFAK